MTHYADYYDAQGNLDHNDEGTPEYLASIAQGRHYAIYSAQDVAEAREALRVHAGVNLS